MASLKLLEVKHRITDHITRIEEKADQEAKKVAKAAKQAEDIDDSLVRPPSSQKQ